jgi:hypothetical protein
MGREVGLMAASLGKKSSKKARKKPTQARKGR